MLLCKACNTRFQNGRSACPSCGRRVFASVPESPKASRVGPLPSVASNPEEPVEPDTDLELGEVDVLAEAVEPGAVEELKPEPRALSVRRTLEAEPGPAVLHLSAAQVRTLVAEQPELIESGLVIHRDEDRSPIGVDYRCPVGAIDLLARDARGGFVVVAVPDPRDVDTLVPEILSRVGYVRKHLATGGENVRGIVVIEEIPEELGYAAAGVSQTVSFKAYRVALTFHELTL